MPVTPLPIDSACGSGNIGTGLWNRVKQIADGAKRGGSHLSTPGGCWHVCGRCYLGVGGVGCGC